MNTWFKYPFQISLALCLGLLPFTLHPPAASALDAVTCVNCANSATQLWSKLTQAQQFAMQAKQLANQIQQYQTMVTNSKTLPKQVWGNAMNDFKQLQSLMLKSKAIAFNAGNLDKQFSSRYGTYESYLKQKMGGADWASKYGQWSREASDNTLYTMKTLGMHANQMTAEQATMAKLQSMAGSTVGQMQALQVANQIAAQNVDQVLKLRQLMMTQMQMQTNYLALQQDKEAAKQAARFKLYNSWTDVPYNDGKKY